MGSPISGYLAEAVLQELETRVFQTYKPKFWMRYVDDTFVILHRNAKDNFKRELDSVFPQIQFTMKEETNGVLSFLDVQTELHLGDDKAVVCPTIAIADGPDHQYVLPTSPPNENIVQQVSAPRSRGNPGGLFLHWQAEEGVGQKEAVFGAGSQEEEEAIVIAAGDSVRAQHSFPGSTVCVDADVERKTPPPPDQQPPLSSAGEDGVDALPSTAPAAAELRSRLEVRPPRPIDDRITFTVSATTTTTTMTTTIPTPETGENTPMPRKPPPLPPLPPPPAMRTRSQSALVAIAPSRHASVRCETTDKYCTVSRTQASITYTEARGTGSYATVTVEHPLYKDSVQKQNEKTSEIHKTTFITSNCKKDAKY
ncbi:hypothetical protein SprV_0301124000 [Sparganum proliferum]